MRFGKNDLKFNVLGPEIAGLGWAGVVRQRLSPHSCDMVAVIAAYCDLLEGRVDGAELVSGVSALPLPGAVVNGYVQGKAGACRIARP